MFGSAFNLQDEMNRCETGKKVHTILINLSPSIIKRIVENPQRARGLHHSVNYSRKGWKKALDPLSQVNFE